MKKRSKFLPHWFKYVRAGGERSFPLFVDRLFVDFLSSQNFGSKVRPAIFLDGVFYPTTTGQAYNVMNMLSALRVNEIDAFLFRCFRGWEDPVIYQTYKFNTTCVHPDIFYDDMGEVVKKIKEHKVTAAVFDTAEVILKQGKSLKESAGTRIIRDVVHVDPNISRLAGLGKKVVNAQTEELLAADKYTDIYWAKTEPDKNDLLNFGVSKNKVRVRNTGINLDSIDFKPRLRLRASIRAIYLGNLYFPPNREGLKVLATTISDCRAGGVDIHLDAVGDGDLTSLKSTYVQINFLGKQNNLNDVFKRYDLAFACPTYGSGMSLKILDYLAAGIPTIANHVGTRGHRREIEAFVLVNNSNSLYTSVRRFVDSSRLYERASLLGRKYASKYFNANENIKGFIEDLSG